MCWGDEISFLINVLRLAGGELRSFGQETDCQSGERHLFSAYIRPSGVGALKHLERGPKPWGFCISEAALDGAAHG
jgi:hypothetical protein